MTVFMSGINMYSMALVMKVVLGWDIHFSIWVSSVTVALYVGLGGLLSAIFNEVLQFVLIWLGALLISIIGLIETGGWSGMVARIHTNFPDQDYTHLWRTLGSFSDNPMGINWIGIVFGLGAVISMGYWTTDFLVVQRVISAKDLRSAKLAPIIGAAFKMARAVHRDSSRPARPRRPRYPRTSLPDAAKAEAVATGGHSYNEVLPIMLARYCGPGLLGLGITALIAGFMSGMAGNVSAFATVWTYDIYRAVHPQERHRRPLCQRRPLVHHPGRAGLHRHRLPGHAIRQHHGLRPGAFQLLHRAAVRHRPARHAVEARHSRRAASGASLAGTASSIGMWAWVKVDPTALQYVALSAAAKDMAENMFRALWSWLICVLVTVVVSLVTKPKPESELVGLVMGCTEIPGEGHLPLYQRPVFWAAVVAAVFVALNIIFW